MFKVNSKDTRVLWITVITLNTETLPSVGNYMFKVNIGNIEQGVKYVQS